VHLIPGMAENIKVTHSSDVAVAEALIREREAGRPQPARLTGGEGRPRPPLVGFGVDTHRLVKKRRLVLGGVEIPHNKGLSGHSDADALIHAICDALLGAAGVGDIGRLFPDTDPRFEDVDSAILLERCVDRIHEAGLCVWNVDTTVVAEAPRLSEHIPAMRDRLSGLLHVPTARVSVKATTNEGLDAVGRGDGITCYAVAALIPLGDAQ
jgi:2-C-methyl-D-erythritol 2,4-cyclodiphosphate synthase